MIADIVLALGFVLSPSSQLRFGGLPIGPGELCFVVWLFLIATRLLKSESASVTRPVRRLLRFWLVFGCSLSIGFVVGALIGDVHDAGLVLHDALAYSLLGAVSVTSVINTETRNHLGRVAWLVGLIGTASVTLQLLAAWNILNVFALDPWYWDRLRGWSQNPNQLAFFCCGLGLLWLHLIGQARQGSHRLVGAACFALSAYVGFLTKSDTFRFAILAGAALLMLVKLWSWLNYKSPRITAQSALAWCVFLSFPLFVALSVPLLSGQASQVVFSLTKNGGEEAASEANLRFTLWQQALTRGFDSGLLGLGPGPHLAIPPELVAARQTENEPENLEHPKVNGTANFEAHNTYLDLLTQGGILALASFVWLIVAAIVSARRGRMAGLAALVIGLALFATTANIVRNPIFWLAITLCMVGEAPKRAVSGKLAGVRGM